TGRSPQGHIDSKGGRLEDELLLKIHRRYNESIAESSGKVKSFVRPLHNSNQTAMIEMKNHQQRIGDAFCALEGLSVGDAFGRHSLYTGQTVDILTRERPFFTPPWEYSDDTEMAIAILEVLEARQVIDQDALARAFAHRFKRNPE